jgi:hypothetical protein
MTNGELIAILSLWAREFQNDSDVLTRNERFKGFLLTEEPDLFQRAAVLTAFVEKANEYNKADI